MLIENLLKTSRFKTLLVNKTQNKLTLCEYEALYVVKGF